METGNDVPAISIKGLVKRFNGLVAVDGVDLEISQGEFFGLLGPNGAGKTTLIRMLVGLSTPTSGSASIFGRDVVKNPIEARRLIGVSPQEYNFDENLKAKEILTYHAGYYGMGREERERRADEILDFLGIKDKAGEYCDKLSGGMKRRLLIGRALMQNPRVLFLDEPTTGVDVQLRRSLWDLLKKLNASGTTIVLTTHYIEEAESLCGRVAIMDHGRIIAIGRPEDLKRAEVDCSKLVLDIEGDSIPDLKVIPEVARYSYGKGKLTVHVTDTGTAAVKLLDYLRSNRIAVRSMHVRESTLEDVFIRLTGRDLRE
ncbi:ABC-type multidrug transport system, ATPase component [Methanocella conradii HZ254]|uniref:ABC-type multidrug transport system, ATPase component n=1 Tax=Methanocella conradii (strain DSM 24694 / JCM 17849 / CGMCC 1.5162 / HZ254) TaxID=1041930 RepID=H8I8U5_METCZ|nr:ABC transporter ATP-binding protein [Methanocella conradii]AFD00416.1 ABC-type multidrug transport system, ATPase component [Methanocella conradii HZ254]